MKEFVHSLMRIVAFLNKTNKQNISQKHFTYRKCSEYQRCDIKLHIFVIQNFPHWYMVMQSRLKTDLTRLS